MSTFPLVHVEGKLADVGRVGGATAGSTFILRFDLATTWKSRGLGVSGQLELFCWYKSQDLVLLLVSQTSTLVSSFPLLDTEGKPALSSTRLLWVAGANSKALLEKFWLASFAFSKLGKVHDQPPTSHIAREHKVAVQVTEGVDKEGEHSIVKPAAEVGVFQAEHCFRYWERLCRRRTVKAARRCSRTSRHDAILGTWTHDHHNDTTSTRYRESHEMHTRGSVEGHALVDFYAGRWLSTSRGV
ncbi:hypothetical protein HDK77DRAFT_242756 [Phyllosticta capitalensis]|uniref:Uncharacterized protein n=1 Tax=Phyllosticta capitalensis TaxID=121624 RepID=A0ABR1YMM1_9PEZI